MRTRKLQYLVPIVAVALVGGTSCLKHERTTRRAVASVPAATQAAYVLECRARSEVTQGDIHLVICSNGDDFEPRDRAWSGNRISIYRIVGDDIILVRDFGKNAFDPLYGVEVSFRERVLFVTIQADAYPGWEPAPFFRERIDISSGRAQIVPLIEVPKGTEADVRKLTDAIRGSSSDVMARNKLGGMPEYFAFFYSRLFRLTELAFRFPARVDDALTKLEATGDYDGEIAETVTTLHSYVRYLQGKEIVL